MTDRKQLIVVLPGIGGSVLARPGGPDDVVWDAGKGDIAGVVFRPDRLSIDEAPHLDPLGLTESTKFLGFTVVASPPCSPADWPTTTAVPCSPPGSAPRPGPSQNSFSASTEPRSPTRSRSTSSPAPTMTLPASTSLSST